MSAVSIGLRLLVVLAIGAPCVAAQTADSAASSKAQTKPASGNKSKSRRHSGTSHPPAALGERPAPAPPSPPPTPAQQPPTAPQVNYRDGLLTVVANNSTLGDILNAVRNQTGASLEYPGGVTQERVMATVGPAPAPQVLAALLNGSHFDYILVGVNGHPEVLQRAIITAKEGAGGPAPGGSAPITAGGPRRTGPPPGAGDDEMDSGPPDENAEQPEEVPNVQQVPVQQPAAQPPQQPPQLQPGQQPGQFPQAPPQPKTPEQLLQELQRLQQQQQQQASPPEQPQPQQ